MPLGFQKAQKGRLPVLDWSQVFHSQCNPARSLYKNTGLGPLLLRNLGRTISI